MAISPTANGSAPRPMTLAPPSMGRPRKYSLPVVIPRPSLSVYAAAAETTKEPISRRRKFSQVGQVVGHRLSTTIGWRSPISQQDVVNQAKSLCGRYLSVSNLACGSNTAEIANELRLLANELENSHPKLFQSVASNLGLHSFPSEAVVHNVFAAVAEEIFRNDVTWGRIVALFAMTGALAMDCVKTGHPEYVLGLVQRMGIFVESDLAPWICQQGGWLQEFFVVSYSSSELPIFCISHLSS
ncbi:Bcl-2-related ovarian killer protein-like protein, partial [Stegodyphus mimosarum]